MKNWELLLIKKLQEHGIRSEKTSFSISSDMKKLRDYEWHQIFRDRQIVELIKPKRKGGKIKLKATSGDDLPVEIGSVSFYDEEQEFKIGIVCWLIEKKLNYANGDVKNCLEFNQPIILIDSNTWDLPQEILKSKTLKIKHKGKSKSSLGCSTTVFLFILALVIWAILILLTRV